MKYSEMLLKMNKERREAGMSVNSDLPVTAVEGDPEHGVSVWQLVEDVRVIGGQMVILLGDDD